MRNMMMVALTVVSAVAFGEEVRVSSQAGTAAGPAFSAVGAKTSGSGANLLEASVGYPGAYVAFLHGFRPELDAGGKLSFNAAFEGMAPIFVSGFKAQAVAKYRFFEKGRWSMGLEAQPGAFVYGTGSQSVGGFTLPVGFKAGIAATDRLGFGLTAEVPFYVTFATLTVPNGRSNLVYRGGVYVPVLVGGGAEFALLKNLLITLETRLGPTYVGPTNRAEFTAQAMAGVAWRI